MPPKTLTRRLTKKRRPTSSRFSDAPGSPVKDNTISLRHEDVSPFEREGILFADSVRKDGERIGRAKTDIYQPGQSGAEMILYRRGSIILYRINETDSLVLRRPLSPIEVRQGLKEDCLEVSPAYIEEIDSDKYR